MVALNIFGKQKTPVSSAPKTEKSEKKKSVPSGGASTARPHITEKATDLTARNQYIFVVQPRATKSEIAKDVAAKYNVNVENVRIINVRAKRIRLGRTQGIKKGYRKAIVQIADGQKIDLIPTT